jgi:hypothetical protein
MWQSQYETSCSCTVSITYSSKPSATFDDYGIIQTYISLNNGFTLISPVKFGANISIPDGGAYKLDAAKTKILMITCFTEAYRGPPVIESAVISSKNIVNETFWTVSVQWTQQPNSRYVTWVCTSDCLLLLKYILADGSS